MANSRAKESHGVAFDESGHTGSNLLDSQQPFFCLASANFDNEEAESLLDCLRTDQTNEIKFQSLRKRSSATKAMAKFFSDERIFNGHVKAFTFHKRFMIVTKIVDMLIVEMANLDGIDLYKNGANIATANMHFYCMPAFCGETETVKVLQNFVDMIRGPSPESVGCFYSKIQNIYNNCSDNGYRESLAPIILSAQHLDLCLAGADRNSLEPAIPSFISIANIWGIELEEDFDVFHDHCKPLVEYGDYLAGFYSKEATPAVIGYDRRQIHLPLRVGSMNFVDSKIDSRVQVVDVLASAATYWARGKAEAYLQDELWECINEHGPANYHIDVVWPSTGISPEELGTDRGGGTNPADGAEKFLSGNKGKVKK